MPPLAIEAFPELVVVASWCLGQHSERAPIRKAAYRATQNIFDKGYAAFDRFLPVTRGRNRPILLKKSAVVSTAEKYVSEIEIFTLSRGFRAQISRSCAQEKHFQHSVRA